MPDRAELRRSRQLREGHDGDHARAHLSPRRRRRGDALRHAGLRGRLADESARRRRHHQRRHRRRSDQRQLVRGHAGAVRSGPGDGRGDDDRRDRRPARGGCGAVREGAHDETGDWVRGGSHRTEGPAHGARRRHHFRLRRHGGRKSGDHALGGTHRRTQPGGAGLHGRPRRS